MNRKVKILFSMMFLCCLVFTMSSCKNDKNPVDTYTITFVSNGGSPVTAITAKTGDKINEPNQPTKASFTFDGWYGDQETATSKYVFLSMPNRNFTLYAKWTPDQSAVVKFDSCGGNAVASITEVSGATIVAPEAPIKFGYDFKGWYEDQGYTKEYVFDKAPSHNITVYAKWERSQNTAFITYVINGEEVMIQPVVKGNLVEVPQGLFPLKTLSDGWFEDALFTEPFDKEQPITADMTVYANCYTEGLQFLSGAVVGYSGTATDIIIPAVFQGQKITKIGESAFYANHQILSVTIPEGIEMIGNYAFYKCQYLQTAMLPTTIKQIGAYAFNGCKRLVAVGHLGQITTIEEGVFSGCTLLTDVVMPESVTIINENAFSGCKSLEVLEISKNVQKIEQYAFADCASVIEFLIPKTTTRIGDGVFSGCTALKQMIVENGNTSYRIVDGNLMNYARNTLILYIQGAKLDEEYTVVAPVHTIKAGAFAGNQNIHKLDISAVSNIEKGALSGMLALEELTTAQIGDMVGGNGFIAYFFGADNPSQNGTSSIYVPQTLRKLTFTGNVYDIPYRAFFGMNSLKEVVGMQNITKIGSYAFAYTGIESFKIPVDVETIEDFAFSDCAHLSAFEVAKGNTTYSALQGSLYDITGKELILVPSGRTEIDIPTTVTTIRANAFNGSHIATLTIRDHITNLEKGALSGANRLEQLIMPYIGDGQNNQYMHHLFGITKKENVADGKIPFDTLAGLPVSLKTIEITGNKITEIPEFAFFGMGSVIEIEYPASVKKIGRYAFSQIGITNVVIPNTVLEIERYAFSYSFNLKSVVVPGSVQTMEKGVFAYCPYIETATFEEGVPEIPDLTFYVYIEQGSTGENLFFSSLKQVTIPSTVKRIGELAFPFAGVFENVYKGFEIKFNNFENSQLEVIGLAAFESAALTSVVLPASVKVLQQEAFGFCDNLVSVQIGTKEQGSNLEKIYGMAFYGGKALAEIIIYKNVLTEADLPVIENVFVEGKEFTPFDGCPKSLMIYVPKVAQALYQAAPIWSDYYVQIKNIEERGGLVQ